MTTSLSLDKAKVFNPYQYYALGGDHTLIRIPKSLTRHKRLSFGAKMCWARLAQYCGENGICNPSYATLGKELGIERRQAVNLVNELIDEGFLRRAKEPGSRTTHFLFAWHPVFEADMPAPSAPMWAKDCPGRSSSGQSIAHQPASARAISCPHTKVGNRPEPKMPEPAQVLDSSGSRVDQGQNSRQSNAHELRVKNKEEKTTTTGRGCVSFLEGARIKIPSEAERYIMLKTMWEQEHGRIRTSVGGYSGGLRRLAAQGKLDLSDLPELEIWKRERDAAGSEAKRRRERVQKEFQVDTQRLKLKMSQNRERCRETVRSMERDGVRPEDWFQGPRLDKALVLRATGRHFVTPELWETLRDLYPVHYARLEERARAAKHQYRSMSHLQVSSV